MLSESPQRVALREFGEVKCAVCGNAKKSRRSFCPKCYYELPENMRNDLYKRFGSGYEEAYDDAKDFLRQEHKASG